MEKFNSVISKDSKIGVLYGGLSNEREVSIRSGNNCFQALKRLGYTNVALIDVQKDIAVKLNNSPIDIAFLALHGTYGEDGCIQGLLEIIGIPYTGSGVLASSMAMNKAVSKNIFAANDIPTANSLVYNSEDLSNGINGKLESIKLKFPVMVKPLSEGSSIGMEKVDSGKDLLNAVKLAGKYKDGVMIEEYIYGKDVTVGVLDINKETIGLPILELRSKTGWYDYKAKYTNGLTEFILPAELDKDTTKLVQDYAVKAHKALGCKGVSRVDFVISENNTPYILEINTLPGMTDLSDLPAQAKCMDIEYDTLVDIILHSSKL